MGYFIKKCSDEEGSVIVVTMLLLAILTLCGISSSMISNTEVKTAANHRFHKITFYAAETGRDYVVSNPDIYGGDNITVDEGLYFPNNDNPDEKYVLTSTQSFNGIVKYTGHSTPPRGSGYDAEKFKAHRYRMDSTGHGPHASQAVVQAGFYRIGF